MAKFSYRDLLPPPLRSDARFAALAGLLADWQDLDVDRVRTLGRTGDAEGWLLQHLAAWLSLDDEIYWTVADDAERRQLLLSAVQLHRKKGTRWAVEESLRLIGVTVDLIEWWQKQPAGQPHTFDLTAWVNDNLAGGATVLSPETDDLVARLVDAYKPARSHYTFRVGARFDQGLAPVAGGELDQVARWRAEARHQIPGIGSGATVAGGGQPDQVARWQARVRAPLQLFAGKPVALAQAAEHPVSIVRTPMEAV